MECTAGCVYVGWLIFLLLGRGMRVDGAGCCVFRDVLQVRRRGLWLWREVHDERGGVGAADGVGR